jgi:protein tyrosine phosphatase (PTP) superfamily phosphohydrolase (DUF442 family)
MESRSIWRRMRRPSGKQVFGFLYVWLMVGFAAGTLVLVAPVRWITDFAHGHGWSQGTEDVIMMGVIGLYLAASLAITIALTRLLFQYRARAFKYGLIVGVTGMAGSALWGWSNPAIYATMAGGMDGESVETESGVVFLFGPYPSRERLEELKAEGISGVISLQHPAVVPFEPEGIQKERAWTEELGLRFIHAPMLPWVSDNRAALETIGRVATEGVGRFYVHCGLGRDRVNVVKHMLERMGVKTEGTQLAQAMGWQERVDQGMKKMARGEAERIGTRVWLVPSPNEHEIFGNMLAGQAGLVVLLLDPARDSVALAQMTRLFDEYAVEYERRPLSADDVITAQQIVQEIRREQRPVTVVAPSTRPHDGAEIADLFLEAWKTGTAIPEPETRPGQD